MTLTRRHLLELLVATPIGLAGGCCTRKYPKPLGEIRPPNNRMAAILAPEPVVRATARRLGRVIDVHAHFFNASDVPVRGFLEECLGHRAPAPARLLLRALARIADRLAERAPTAAEELADLADLLVRTDRVAIAADVVRVQVDRERQLTAERVADAIRGSEFERLYRQMKQRGPGPAAQGRTGPLSPDEVLEVVREAERPSPPGGQPAAAEAQSTDAAIADGMLGFLNYMLSRRWVNLQSYMKAFTLDPDAFGVDAVLGALVDFDYWLDCPPGSAQDDQVRLHQRLFELHNRSASDSSAKPYFYPLVAYNPWTDINQDGAGLARVIDACTKGNFVGAKIYPPTGFRPAANATIPATTKKSRPDLKKLDATLKVFFAKCAELRIPVLAHSAHSNGRDDAHDEFGGPAGWKALVQASASAAQTPIVDFGHFGGGRGPGWTQEFADLMAAQPRAALFGDLGYWEELMCAASPSALCTEARKRLQDAVAVAIPGSTETVVDRTMFATDWLMLSQVKRWAQYPAQVYESLLTIMSEDDAAKVFGGNAVKCFRL